MSLCSYIKVRQTTITLQQINQDTTLQKSEAKHFSKNKQFPSFINIQTSQPHVLLDSNKDLVKTNLLPIRPVTPCRWHRRNKQGGWPSWKAAPVATQGSQRSSNSLKHRGYSTTTLGRLSGHHQHSDEKRHSPSLYVMNYPKSKQWDALLAPKPALNYTDLLQPHGAVENSPST